MQRLQKALIIVVIVLVAIVVLSLGAGYWFLTQSLAQTNGNLHVAGLQARVEVIRDSLGIPHIYADNADDLFFAQGYVHAQDRLWQMELNRMTGHGRLAELFGNIHIDKDTTAVQADEYLRTLGLTRAAQRDLDAASADEKRVLDNYTRGVNAFVEAHRDNLPLEFTLLGRQPEPWKPIDSAVWAKAMALDLGGNMDEELLRVKLIDKFGADKLSDLLPPYPADGPFIIPTNPANTAGPSGYPTTQLSIHPTTQLSNLPIGDPDLSQYAFLTHRTDDGTGSNDWVVDGTKTTTGKPLLANDPHLSIRIPSIWYANALHCRAITQDCPYNVIGFSFAGTPGVVVGHNARIAWGVTNVGPDVQDLFVEKVNPANPNEYEYQGKWETMQVVEEPIRVNDVLSETLKVQITRHGPIMTPVLKGVTVPLALQWTALSEPGTILGSVLKIDRAQNWSEFRDALRDWDVPSQNFVFADVDGNIGYQMPGRIPIRAQGDGTRPVPGWTGAYEWTGYVPFDELPSAFNPAQHFVATANNQVVPNDYKYLITRDWSAPFRAMRITQLLQARDKLSPDDFKKIHGDVYSIPLTRMQTYVAALPPQGFLQERAMTEVKNWDGNLTPDNTGGTILEVFYQRLVRNTFGNKMDAKLLKNYLGAEGSHRMALLALLEQPTSDWWDDPATPSKETRDDIVKKSFAEAVDWLGSQFGDAPPEWRWGRLHTATFEHPIGSVKPLNLIFNAGPFPMGGDGQTIFNTRFADADPYGEQTVPSLRAIYDVSNWNNSQWMHTTGESGQPLSKHYTDMIPLWRAVQYAPMPFDRAAVEQAKEGVLVLEP